MTDTTDRDVARFDRWSSTYDEDRLQRRFFRPVYAETLAVVADLAVAPRRILDVGCGTGTVLKALAERYPEAHGAGVDAAFGMVAAARRPSEGRLPARRVAFTQAVAEALPFADAAFDLAVSTVTFHHWADQRRALREVGRVLGPGGFFVLADLHAVGWLRWFHTVTRNRDRMHTKDEVGAMLADAGMRVRTWAPIFDLDVLLSLRRSGPDRRPRGRAPLVSAVVAQRENA